MLCLALLCQPKTTSTVPPATKLALMPVLRPCLAMLPGDLGSAELEQQVAPGQPPGMGGRHNYPPCRQASLHACAWVIGLCHDLPNDLAAAARTVPIVFRTRLPYCEDVYDLRIGGGCDSSIKQVQRPLMIIRPFQSKVKGRNESVREPTSITWTCSATTAYSSTSRR